ncbi:MAG TPA: hypothetical protein DGN59_02745 [Candidatus Latescibacteria bacterium]|nr:hypothetical protein [Candidatus Latescibacterota bacterium]
MKDILKQARSQDCGGAVRVYPIAVYDFGVLVEPPHFSYRDVHDIILRLQSYDSRSQPHSRVLTCPHICIHIQS